MGGTLLCFLYPQSSFVRGNHDNAVTVLSKHRIQIFGLRSPGSGTGLDTDAAIRSLNSAESSSRDLPAVEEAAAAAEVAEIAVVAAA